MLIDLHVHIVGNGSSGSGCWLKLRGLNKILSRFMLAEVGLPKSALTGDLDTIYVEKLLEFVQRSSLDKVVILAHENPYTDSGTLIDNFGSLYVPNDYVLQLGKKHPQFLPAISIHPARADAIAELERGVAEGAVIMKCLPNCQNIDCSLPKYKPFWKKMADLRLPLLAHTGGELSLPVYNKALQNPEILREVLDQGVTVIAAHLGTASHPLDTDYFDNFTALCKQYPNLYGDNSALISPFRSKRLLEALRDEGLLSRIVHGSDLPIPSSSFWLLMRGWISWAEHHRLSAIKNPLERDYQIKRALGFPIEVASRAASLLRLT